MGHLRKRRTGVYELVVDTGRDPLTGVRRQRTPTFRGTEREARRALRRLEEEVEAGSLQGPNTTMAALLDRYMALRTDLEETTRQTYEATIARHIKPALGHIRVSRLTTEDIDNFYSALQAKGLGPSTVRHHHAILRPALSRARKWKWILVNPADDVELPEPRKREVALPEEAAVLNLLETTARADPELASYLRLKASLGARRGEMCALRWSDVDWDPGTEGGADWSPEIRIARSVAKIRGVWKEKDTKTHRSRAVGLSEGDVTELRDLRDRQQAQAAHVGKAWSSSGFLFSPCAPACHFWTPDQMSRKFDRARERAPGVRNQHQLRHFSASQQLAAGVDAKTISERHGWADANMLYNTYGHALKARDRAAAAVMDEVLRGPRAEESPASGA